MRSQTEKIDELTALVEQLENENSALERKRHAEKKRLLSDIRRLETRLQASVETNTNQANALEQQRQKCEELEEETTELAEQKVSLQRKLRESCTVSSYTRNQLKSAHSQIAALKEQLEQLEMVKQEER
jgi:chromosome segregation ATPase